MRSPDSDLIDPEAIEEAPAPVRAWRLGVLLAGIAALGVLTNWYLVLTILLLIVCIYFHELGHYLAATRGGMKVTEFFIGFGPRLWSFHRGETEYGIKAIPAGAYVRIIGMSSADEIEPEDEARTYRQGSFGRRMLVAVAGSGMHFIIAILLIWTLLVFSGAKSEDHWQVADVSAGSAAAAAGIGKGDRVVSVDGVEVDTHAKMATQVKRHAGETVPVGVERKGELRTVDVTLGARANIYGTVGEDISLASYNDRLRINSVVEGGALTDAGVKDGDAVTAINGVSTDRLDQLPAAVAASKGGKVVLDVDRDGVESSHTVDLGKAVKLSDVTGFLGVGRELVPEKVNPVRAVGTAAQRFGSFVWFSAGRVAQLPLRVVEIVQRAVTTAPGSSSQVTDKPTPATAAAQQELQKNENRPISIIGTVAIGSGLARDGWVGVLEFLILFNIVIGIFNLLPLPPLDGGHVMVACYEKIRELFRGDGRRYIADAQKLVPVALAVLVVLGAMGVSAMYLDIVDPLRL